MTSLYKLTFITRNREEVITISPVSEADAEAVTLRMLEKDGSAIELETWADDGEPSCSLVIDLSQVVGVTREPL